MLRLSKRASWIITTLCPRQHRSLATSQSTITTLAIETSCDDTSVAVIDVDGSTLRDQASCRVRYHRTATANSQQYNGIHPVVAIHSHQANLAALVAEAREQLYEDGNFKPPTFVSVTRGPGIRSCLTTGLMLAKGLSVAWNVPLIGVHHMQAHALTPRLCSALADSDPTLAGPQAIRADTGPADMKQVSPRFPYLTVLVSGGHTMLLRSTSLVEHQILAESQDIAIGDCLDKAARAIVPPEQFTAPHGKALEQFAFPNDADEGYDYTPPRNREQEVERRITKWKWSLRPPLAQNKKGEKSRRRMMFSFSGLLSSVRRFMQYEVTVDGSLKAHDRTGEISIDERREMAREVLRLTFEHLVSRILIHLSEHKEPGLDTIVVSGGVAANKFLRHVLRQTLDARGFSHIRTIFPPVQLCTDNALMIAWAGVEMFEAGHTSSLDVTPIRKWSMDSTAIDGGILSVDGWIHSR